MIRYLNELVDAGVTSFKIEGRMKSPYYVATVVNAYRRAIDNYSNGVDFDEGLIEELEKTSHRRYTTGFFFGAKDKEYIESSMPIQTHEFMAIVKADYDNGKVLIEQRNRFKVGDELEVLSPNDTFNKIIKIEKMEDEKGKVIKDASLVQQQIYLTTDLKLMKGDILRKKIDK